MNAPAVIEKKQSYAEVAMAATDGGGMLTPRNLGDVVAFAQVMARAGHAIPKHLRDNPGACLAVTMQALRLEMDPFAVASKSYQVGDTIAYEAQLIAAAINTRAPLLNRPRITFTGEGAGRVCTVTATFRGETEPTVHDSPKFGMITPKNSPLWKSDPDQQHSYYTLRAFGRRHCPEVILGMYDREEMDDRRVRDETAEETPGLRARLEAQGAPSTEGFSAEEQPSPEAEISASLDETLDGDNLPELKTGAQLLAEKIEAAEPPAEPEAEFEELPLGGALDEQVEAATPPDMDPLDWAASFTKALDQMATEAEIDDALKNPVNKRRYADLKAANEPVAKALDKAIVDRRAAIKAG